MKPPVNLDLCTLFPVCLGPDVFTTRLLSPVPLSANTTDTTLSTRASNDKAICPPRNNVNHRELKRSRHQGGNLKIFSLLNMIQCNVFSGGVVSKKTFHWMEDESSTI